MSGICGIVNFDGAPVDPELLKKMVHAAAYRGPDGIHYWIEGNVGLAHLALHTTPESLREKQPLVGQQDELTVVADARVDNRDELIRTLTSKGYLLEKDPTDTELILAAYQCWYEDCPKYIVGDFAFTIWDRRAARLFAARDVIGIRQFYYTQVGDTLYFGTTIRSILAVLPGAPTLNDRLIGEYLRGRYNLWVCQTVYEQILRLPPAHLLIAERDQLSLGHYYVLGSGPMPACSSDSEWAEGFRELLDQAIKCRLRSISPIGIQVGGGLDSSSIACAAHNLAREYYSLPPVRLYASIFDETPKADERDYFEAVAAHCERFTSKRIISDQFWALKEFGVDAGFPLDEPEVYTLRSHTLALLRTPAADGCKVILAGEGANQVLGHAVYYHPQALRGVGLLDLPFELKYYIEKTRMNAIMVFLRAYVRPLVPEKVLQLIRSLRPMNDKSPNWLKQVDQSIGGDDCLHNKAWKSPSELAPWALIAYQQLQNPYDLARYSALDVTAAYVGVEWRFPFLDRRVVDFLLHIPHSLTSWGGQDRVILREAMRGTLPQMVRERRTKSDLLELFHRGLRENERLRIQALLSHSRAEALGYLDTQLLCEAMEPYWQGRTDEFGKLELSLGLEAWLRSIEDMVLF